MDPQQLEFIWGINKEYLQRTFGPIAHKVSLPGAYTVMYLLSFFVVSRPRVVGSYINFTSFFSLIAAWIYIGTDPHETKEPWTDLIEKHESLPVASYGVWSINASR